jgi:hypothetical protein
MSRAWIFVACACLFSLGAVNFVLKPKPVAMKWSPLMTNLIASRPVFPAGASFAPCEPMVAMLGSFAQRPPKTVYTPDLVTRAECAVLRAEQAADNAWFSLTSRVGYGTRLDGLTHRVLDSLRHGEPRSGLPHA